MTARDLITASLRLLGAIASGESLDASEASDGLATLNRLLDSWSNEELLVTARVREQLTLTVSQSAYTVGTAGNLNTARPQKIDEALIRDDSVAPAQEYLVDLISLDQWASIGVKDIDGIPYRLYSDNAYPQTSVNLFPRPDKAYKLVLYSWKPLTTIASIDDTFSLPPGWERALTFNLAIDLAPEYGRPVPDVVGMTAVDSKAALKRMNYRAGYLSCDPAVASRGRFNIYTGDK